ncbi:hypothetical protein H0H92_011205, partial [Tricholoma furcatifolium]
MSEHGVEPDEMDKDKEGAGEVGSQAGAGSVQSDVGGDEDEGAEALADENDVEGEGGAEEGGDAVLDEPGVAASDEDWQPENWVPDLWEDWNREQWDQIHHEGEGMPELWEREGWEYGGADRLDVDLAGHEVEPMGLEYLWAAPELLHDEPMDQEEQGGVHDEDESMDQEEQGGAHEIPDETQD